MSRKLRPWNLKVNLVWSNPKKVQDGGVKIVYVDLILGDVEAQVVAFPDGHPALHCRRRQATC